MSAPPVVWDIERHGAACSRCGAAIGAGEAFRRGRRIVGRKLCEACSIAIDDTPAPADVYALDFAGRLRADVVAGPKPRQVAGPTPVTPGSQPVIHPSGMSRFNRHGIVEAMRRSFGDVDVRRRASGDSE